MHSLCTVTTTAEYDLLQPNASTATIEAYFRKPLATWDHGSLEAGESEAVQRAFVKNTETREIEIDRDEEVVLVTYLVTVEIEYTPHELEYFGASLEQIIENGCHVSFPLDDRVVELASEERSVLIS